MPTKIEGALNHALVQNLAGHVAYDAAMRCGDLAALVPAAVDLAETTSLVIQAFLPPDRGLVGVPAYTAGNVRCFYRWRDGSIVGTSDDGPVDLAGLTGVECSPQGTGNDIRFEVYSPDRELLASGWANPTTRTANPPDTTMESRNHS